MLEARGLTKRYGGFLALDRVDFHVRRGEILGYLGPNGSGKSTTVNTVVGLIDPSAGSLWLDGAPIADDPVAYKRRIGYVPEEPHLYTHLTAVEYLMLVGRLRGLTERTLAEKIPALLQLLLLWDSRYATMAAYSKGMRQRVLLAAALMHNPDLLVLDEPFSGLDVTASLLFRTLLRMFAAGDRMVLFSTHRFDMVEQLCSRVVILSKGRIAAEHDMAAFRNRAVSIARGRLRPDHRPGRLHARRPPDPRSDAAVMTEPTVRCRLRRASPKPPAEAEAGHDVVCRVATTIHRARGVAPHRALLPRDVRLRLPERSGRRFVQARAHRHRSAGSSRSASC